MILVSQTPLRGVQNSLPIRDSVRTREKNYMAYVVTAQELKAIHERSVREHMTRVQEMPSQKSSHTEG